ncbi:hypothetical protein RM844_28645 [Streptomyces sp. DSM 44915]|uniref:DUF3618 domain-containing protein n=1 Tax=Streptomyces chisholmiae TaxID=3075540 RepID=A0ABU2JZP8_9ACTN|nr:hypothetical protein [Streptomyces sp. DSM 44915]MDT0270246.1 hypothetical protein [Streptomyces sp. DSM 44915]
MADEPTLGEVARRLADVHADLKEDLHQLAGRLDGKVSLDIFELRMKTLEKDIAEAAARAAAVEAGQAERDRRRAADRRLAFSALVAPVLLLLLQVYLSARGAGSA